MPLGLGRALAEMTASFERLCLAAGLEALGALIEADVAALCGPPQGWGGGWCAQRSGRTRGPIGFHDGKVPVTRPRVRARGGQEFALPGRERAVAENWLRRWAMTLMRIGVTTRRFGQAVRLPEADVPAGPGSGVSKSAASRRFVALSAERLTAWLDADLSRLDLLAVQIDGIHLAEDLLEDLPLVAAVGIDGEGRKLSLGLIEGATENAAVVQALLDDLVKRGLAPSVPRLFLIDGAKALSKAIRRSFGRDTPIQRCRSTRRATSSTGCPSTCTSARLDPPCAAAGLGPRRRRARGDAALQPLPQPGARGAGRGRDDPEEARRDPHRRSAGLAEGAAPLARLHQHH
jgi:transposase-like protein